MALRRRPWVAAALVVLAACSGGPPNLVMRPTAPAGGSSALRRAARTAPTVAGLPVSPWGVVPVSAPARLRSTADAYYDGAGPLPNDEEPGRPACLLMLPTALGSDVDPVPSSRFDVFGHFVVTWALADRRGAASEARGRHAWGPDRSALLRPVGRGHDVLRRLPAGASTPDQPRAALVRLPTQNCEYELDPGAGLAPTNDPAIISSLRLIYAP